MKHNCSSNPLLSLSHKYQWNKPSTCPYITYIYDKGVDRTGRQGIEENYSITRGKWKKNKKKTDYAPWGVQCENRKKTPQQKHINHRHTLQQGKWSSSSRQPSGPAAILGAGHRPACQAGGFQSDGGEGWGEGKWMSVIREGARESHCSTLPRVVIQHDLGRGRCLYGGARKDTIDLFCLWGE